MTESSGATDREDAGAWRERLGWTFGLIDDDPEVRAKALKRLATANRAVTKANDHNNTMWFQAQKRGGDYWREPSFVAARQALTLAHRKTLPGGLWQDYPAAAQSLVGWPGLPYVLLYLEWEARFNDVWTEHSKHWGAKERLLRRLAVTGHEPWSVAKLTDLIATIVARRHRCKDRCYGPAARAVDNPDLRRRLAAAVSGNVAARLNASYLLWLMDHPEEPAKPATFERWRSENGL